MLLGYAWRMFGERYHVFSTKVNIDIEGRKAASLVRPLQHYKRTNL